MDLGCRRVFNGINEKSIYYRNKIKCSWFSYKYGLRDRIVFNWEN